jgi:hypothetical protein
MLRHGSIKKRAARIVASLGVIGLLIGATSVIAGAASGGAPHEVIHPVTSSPATSSPATSPSSSPYPTNAAGETYGSAAGATSSQEEPDLIEAIGVSSSGDVTGYVRKLELDEATGATVQTPQEAIAWTQSHTGGAATSIPLYAEDGTTVVGKFTIPAQSATPPAPSSP